MPLQIITFACTMLLMGVGSIGMLCAVSDKSPSRRRMLFRLLFLAAVALHSLLFVSGWYDVQDQDAGGVAGDVP